MEWWQGVVLLTLLWAGVRYAVGYPQPPAGIYSLGARGYAVIQATAAATFPRGGAVPPSALDVDVASHVDRFLRAQPWRNRVLIRLLLVLVEHATLLYPAPGPDGWRRFSALRPEQQVRYLEGWRASGWFARRLVFTSLRAIVTMGYLGHPTVLASLGIRPLEIEARPCAADGLWPPIDAPAAAREGRGR